jgi:hypothetical protein
MLRIKSTIATGLLATSLLAYSLPSNAMFGIACFPVGGAPQGVLLAIAGIGLMIDGATHVRPDAVAEELVGLIALDGAQGQTFVFKPVLASEAQSLNLTQDELTAYNSQLDEINDVRESVIADLSAMKNPTVADSQAAWKNYDSALSPEAVSAIEKIGASQIRQ